MTATITAQGQITIPLPLRQKFHLNAGDQVEFDETAQMLTARRVVSSEDWQKTWGEWQQSAAQALKDHPWENQSAASIVDDLRGGPVERSPASK